MWKLFSQIKSKLKLNDFMNMMRRKMLGSKRDELTEGWIKLHIKMVND